MGYISADLIACAGDSGVSGFWIGRLTDAQ